MARRATACRATARGLESRVGLDNSGSFSEGPQRQRHSERCTVPSSVAGLTLDFAVAMYPRMTSTFCSVAAPALRNQGSTSD